MNKTEQIGEVYLSESTAAFRSYKKLAERAIRQVSDEEFFTLIDAESNSIAVIVKHLGGNLRSRWTDFLTSDGEKPDRDRDSEFVAENETRDDLMRIWENGWQALFETLESLSVDDLGKTVTIRGEPFTVVKAIQRSVTHTAYHVGQIAFLAKYLRSSEWKTLSIPKNKSADFNHFIAQKEVKNDYLEAGSEFAEKT